MNVELYLRLAAPKLKPIADCRHDIETSVAISDTVFILGPEPDKAGATIKKEIDLIERDLAWVKEIKAGAKVLRNY